MYNQILFMAFVVLTFFFIVEKGTFIFFFIWLHHLLGLNANVSLLHQSCLFKWLTIHSKWLTNITQVLSNLFCYMFTYLHHWMLMGVHVMFLLPPKTSLAWRLQLMEQSYKSFYFPPLYWFPWTLLYELQTNTTTLSSWVEHNVSLIN